MTDKKPTRRSILKQIGRYSLGAAGISLVSGGASAQEIEEASAETLKSIDVPAIIYQVEAGLPDGFDYDREGTVTVQWFGSNYYDDKGWEHEWAIASAAGSTEDWVTGGEIYAQRYKARGPDGDLWASVEDEYVGVYPEDGEDAFMPSWSVPLMEAAIGTVHVGFSWFSATGSALQEKFGVNEGYQIGGGEIEYNDTHGGLTAWSECGHYHRFLYETGDTYQAEAEVESAFGINNPYCCSPSYRGVEITVETNSPYTSPTPMSDDEEVEPTTVNPYEMTSREREVLGIKKVEPDVVSHLSDDSKLRSEDGELPLFVATKPMLKVTSAEQKAWEPEEGWSSERGRGNGKKKGRGN